MRMGRRGVRFLEDGKEWGLPGLLHSDDLVLCGNLEEDLGGGWTVCSGMLRTVLKINASKSKVMVVNGVERLECEVHVDGIRLEHVSEFKYLGDVLNESGTNGAECSRKVANGRSVATGQCHWVPS